MKILPFTEQAAYPGLPGIMPEGWRIRKELKEHLALANARMTPGDELNKNRDLVSRGIFILSRI